jgi:hypothetical protein
MAQKRYTIEEYWYRPLPESVRAGSCVRPPGKSEPPLKDGLPWQAYAVVGDRADPCTWHLPHHTKMVKKAVKGKIGCEHTVDWKAMPRMVYKLSRYGRQAEHLPLDENQVLQAASHLSTHYIKADKPLPDALAVLS